MAKPRVFISSTFYDLQQVRANIDQFIEDLGYESIRNEEGDISYGKEQILEDYCYREVSIADIFVNIIGGKFGSQSTHSDYSITQQELKTALDEEKQVYIFIQKDVFYEYRTYLLNKDSDTIKYKYVNDIRIYKFIEELYNLPVNNNIKAFETSSDITAYLKSQFAGLFQRFLGEQRRLKESSLIKRLEDATKNIDGLVSFLRDENKGQKDEINQLLKMNHPLVSSLKEKLKIPYNFYIEGIKDLEDLMSARGYKRQSDHDEFYCWKKEISNKSLRRVVNINKSIFEADGNIRFIKQSDWGTNNLIFNEEEIAPVTDIDDLPF